MAERSWQTIARKPYYEPEYEEEVECDTVMVMVNGSKAGDDDPIPTPTPGEYGHVLVTGGSVNIRSVPGVESKDIGTAHKGDLLVYQGVTRQAGGRDWYLIIYENQNAWISSKYSELVA